MTAFAQNSSVFSAPAHRLFTSLKSHKVLEISPSRTMALFAIPFSSLVHVHKAPSNECNHYSKLPNYRVDRLYICRDSAEAQCMIVQKKSQSGKLRISLIETYHSSSSAFMCNKTPSGARKYCNKTKPGTRKMGKMFSSFFLLHTG